MSKSDGPPAKVIKYEMESQFLEGEVMTDEGHEEWLSEGILTDEDYNPEGDHSQGSSIVDQTIQEVTVEGDENPDAVAQECVADGQDDTTGSLQSDDLAEPLLQNFMVQEARDDQIVQTADDSLAASDAQTQHRTNEGRNSKIGDNERKSQDSVSQDSSADTNIEETLNNFENARDDSLTPDLPDDLDTYLIRKAAVPAPAPANDPPAPPQRPDDDGNDTDDLLQMLGDYGNKGKKKQLTRKAGQSQSARNARRSKPTSSDDDELIYTGKSTRINKIQATRSLLSRKPASKAEPEPDSDLSDSEPLLKKMPESVTIKFQSAGAQGDGTQGTGVKLRPRSNPPKQKTRVFYSTPVKTSVNKRLLESSNSTSKANNSQKNANSPKINTSQQKTNSANSKVNSSQQKKVNSVQQKEKTSSSQQKVSSSTKASVGIQKVRTSQQKGDSVVQKTVNTQQTVNKSAKQVQNNKSLLKAQAKATATTLKSEEMMPESDEEDAAHTKLLRDRLMQPAPETMDEDMLLDDNTDSEHDFMLQDMPSSGSDSLDDLFTLDIRSERAGEYLPLLGERAQKLLLEEKSRLQDRLSTLKTSLTALADSGKKQAEELRKTTIRVAELDALLQTT